MTALVLTAVATVILGLSDMSGPVGLAFVLMALVTPISALDLFFNYRARWILMEDARAKFTRLSQELEFRRLRNSGPLNVDDLFEEYQRIWRDGSDAWIAERRRGDQLAG